MRTRLGAFGLVLYTRHGGMALRKRVAHGARTGQSTHGEGAGWAAMRAFEACDGADRLRTPATEHVLSDVRQNLERDRRPNLGGGNTVANTLVLTTLSKVTHEFTLFTHTRCLQVHKRCL